MNDCPHCCNDDVESVEVSITAVDVAPCLFQHLQAIIGHGRELRDTLGDLRDLATIERAAKRIIDTYCPTVMLDIESLRPLA